MGVDRMIVDFHVPPLLNGQTPLPMLTSLVIMGFFMYYQFLLLYCCTSSPSLFKAVKTELAAITVAVWSTLDPFTRNLESYRSKLIMFHRLGAPQFDYACQPRSKG